MTRVSSADVHRNKARCIVQILLWIVLLREKLTGEGNGKGEVEGRRVKEKGERKGENKKQREGEGRETQSSEF